MGNWCEPHSPVQVPKSSGKVGLHMHNWQHQAHRLCAEPPAPCSGESLCILL